jgi:O-antigen/teichoic acid export membrane protein
MPVAPLPPTAAHKGFVRAVLVLVSGTALAHGLTAAALPVVSRLYSPADFGVLAVFSSLLSIIAVAACLRFELAIPLPEADEDALQLLAVSLMCCLSLSLLIALAVALAPDWIARQLGQPGLAKHLWLLPAGVLLAGAYSALQFWHVRHKHFTLLARTRVAQSAGSGVTQIGLGWGGIGPLGLLLGYMMNTSIAFLALGGQPLRAAPGISGRRMRALAFEYRRFPQYSSFEALANSASIQLPIIMIAALATASEAGYLMMAMYVAQAPMSLIGTAVSQVYLSRAPEELRAGRLGPFTAEILSGLFKAGVGPLLAIGILSPALFGLVFGGGWERAGWLVAWMTPWFVLQFLAVPVSMALAVTGHQRASLLLQLLGLGLRVGMVWSAGRWHASLASEAYAISGALFYLAYLSLILVVVRAPLRRLLSGLTGSLTASLAWTGAAALLAGGFQLARLGGLL